MGNCMCTMCIDAYDFVPDNPDNFTNISDNHDDVDQFVLINQSWSSSSSYENDSFKSDTDTKYYKFRLL